MLANVNRISRLPGPPAVRMSFDLYKALPRPMFTPKEGAGVAKNSRRNMGKAFPIVGIGASAGGLEAFRQMLEKLPVDTGMGFVLVQHLDPTHQSQLTELLSRATRLPVIEARNHMVVKPNHIYVIPPNTSMGIIGHTLKVTPRAPGRSHNLPIDAFLESLAKQCGRRAIGVILSGTATDGAEGMKAIRAEGGITFAQDEKSAKYDGMPRAAAATGCVDFVASPGAIAKELAQISRHPYVNHARPEKTVEAPQEPGEDLEQIFRLLRSATGVDFTHYKPNTIRRRIQRRMAVRRLHDLKQYTRYLKDHPDEAEVLYEDLLISVTSFFRDAGSFGALKKKVFPRIVNGLRSDSAIRVWVPGCATGEEVYSLAILLLEYLGERAVMCRSSFLPRISVNGRWPRRVWACFRGTSRRMCRRRACAVSSPKWPADIRSTKPFGNCAFSPNKTSPRTRLFRISI